MDGFLVREAVAGGLARSSLYSGRYAAPFHGVRTAREPDGHLALCRAALLALPDQVILSHRSAAVLHGIPLPRRAEPALVEVSVLEPQRTPRRRGVLAHQLTPTGQRVVTIGGMRAFAPEEVWVQLGTALGPDELTVAGDYVIAGTEPYDGAPPPATRAQLDGALRRHGRHRGVANLRAAAGRIRYGSLSPQETRLRLALQDAGLPEPELNYRVADGDGRVRAMIDLAYPGFGVAIEYLGDHHRATSTAYRADITRRELLVRLGWKVVFVTAADPLPAVAARVRTLLPR